IPSIAELWLANIAHSFWLGSQACDSCSWSGRTTHFALGRGFLYSTLLPLQPRQCPPRRLTRESLGIREGFLCIRTSRFPERATGDDPHLLRHRRHRRYAASKEFCILHTSSFPFLLSVSAPRATGAKSSTAREASR